MSYYRTNDFRRSIEIVRTCYDAMPGEPKKFVGFQTQLDYLDREMSTETFWFDTEAECEAWCNWETQMEGIVADEDC